jgi:hypothetical protein
MPNKLALSTETLRVLGDEELAGVAGAKNTGMGKCKRKKSGKKKKGKGCTK